ncbi:MAG: HAD family hydrolase [Actinomycetes bacterium]
MTADAVLFDLDGLLIDSEPVWYAVEEAAVERLGGTWSLEHQANCVGGTMTESCAYIVELTGAGVDPAELAQQLLDEMAARFAEHLPLHRGAIELLDALAARAVPVGLVTSSYWALVNPALKVLGAHRFAVVVTGEDVTRGKPDPEPYALACVRLGVAPHRTVVLEDAPFGVASAEAAGCRVVAVPSVAPVEPTPGRTVVESLEDVDVECLLRLVPGSD